MAIEEGHCCWNTHTFRVWRHADKLRDLYSTLYPLAGSSFRLHSCPANLPLWSLILSDSHALSLTQTVRMKCPSLHSARSLVTLPDERAHGMKRFFNQKLHRPVPNPNSLVQIPHVATSWIGRWKGWASDKNMKSPLSRGGWISHTRRGGRNNIGMVRKGGNERGMECRCYVLFIEYRRASAILDLFLSFHLV